MREHTRSRIAFDLANQQQAAYGGSQIDGAEAAIGALRAGRFIQMPDQHDRAACALRDVAQLAEDRAHFVGAIHVDLRAEKCLHRIDDQQSCMVLPNGFFNPVVRKCELLVAVVNDEHTVKVCSRFQKAGLYRVAESILCSLIDYIEGIKRFCIRQFSVVCTGSGQLHGEIRFSFAGIALQDGQLAERNVRIPEPFDLCLGDVAHANHADRFFRIGFPQNERIQKRLGNIFPMLKHFVPVLEGRHIPNDRIGVCK